MPPNELQAKGRGLPGRPSSGRDAGGGGAAPLAEDVLATARDNIARDPIEWAAKTGLIQVPELDLYRARRRRPKSLKARAAVAGEIATYYGRDVRYFRESEKQALVSATRQGGPQLVDLAATLVGSLGTEAPKALAEISRMRRRRP